MRRRMFLAGLGAAMSAPALALAQDGEQITPENELERSFIAAFSDPDARPAFRRELLVSQVALAFATDAADAAPRRVALPSGAMAGAIFSSTARLNSVLGPASPRRVMSGREALARLRGGHAVLNYRLLPMLTLEAEDIAAWLGG